LLLTDMHCSPLCTHGPRLTSWQRFCTTHPRSDAKERRIVIAAGSWLLPCVAARASKYIIARSARKRHRESNKATKAEYISLNDLITLEQLDEAHLNQLDTVLHSLATDGMGVVPTDTQNAYVTAMSSKRGTQRIYNIKGVADQRKPLSLLCSDLSMASRYCDMTAIPRRWFQALKTCLPGPYTFILRASAEVPRVVLEHKAHSKIWKRREVGIRVPDHPVVKHLVQDLDAPLLSSSAPADAWDIWEQHKSKLDFVVAAPAEDWQEIQEGASTVLDLTMEEPVLRRQGLGDVSAFEGVIEASVAS